jgi:hypothetical protein
VSQSEMTFRHSLMWRMNDFSKGRGLEIGPLHNATVTRDKGDVRYVDVFSREQLVKNYASEEQVIAERIPEIDFILSTDDGFQTLKEAAAPGAPYDWVTASHVIEHTPDVIGWLGEIADLVVDVGLATARDRGDPGRREAAAWSDARLAVASGPARAPGRASAGKALEAAGRAGAPRPTGGPVEGRAGPQGGGAVRDP